MTCDSVLATLLVKGVIVVRSIDRAVLLEDALIGN